jgi:hypothetical protein
VSPQPTTFLPPFRNWCSTYKHFRYIFSPTIEGYISFPAACSSLAACAVTYLCREHHDPELNNEDVQHYVLSGAYTLHNFAANFLHLLITQCLNQKDRGGMSEEMLRCLSRLCDTRRSLDFQAEEQEDNFATRETTAMKHLRSEWPDVVDLILDLKSFHDQSSRALYSLTSGMYTTSPPFARGYAVRLTVLSDKMDPSRSAHSLPLSGRRSQRL